MTTITSDEFLTTRNKINSSTLGRELSDRHHSNRISINPAEEWIYADDRNCDGYERTGSEDEDRDEMLNIDQTFKDPKNNNLRKSEAAGYRLYLQAQERKQRKETLRQTFTFQPNLPSKRRKIQGTTHDIKAINGRIIALYELGRSRVTANRELASTKLKVHEVIANNESIEVSERITALYKLGKSKVTTNRELASTQLLPSDNLAVYIAALSVTKASASEIAGLRLHIQAMQRAERKYSLIQKSRATRPPKMELATQQRSREKLIEREMSPNERFSALYEQGKNRIIADRELEIKDFERKIDASNEEKIAGYASMRQMELYELGKKKVINGRLNEKKRGDITNDDSLSSQSLTAIDANARMIKLYEISKNMQKKGKERREQIVRDKKDLNNDIHQVHRPLKEITINAVMVKLYAMSQPMQKRGKKRRGELFDAKVTFPVFKI